MSLSLLEFLIKKNQENEMINFNFLHLAQLFPTHTDTSTPPAHCSTYGRIHRFNYYESHALKHVKKVNIFIYLVLTGRQPLDV